MSLAMGSTHDSLIGHYVPNVQGQLGDACTKIGGRGLSMSLVVANMDDTLVVIV